MTQTSKLFLWAKQKARMKFQQLEEVTLLRRSGRPRRSLPARWPLRNRLKLINLRNGQNREQPALLPGRLPTLSRSPARPGTGSPTLAARKVMTTTRLIRNFSIIAHIDHGKSTLADRFCSKPAASTAGTSAPQVLDDMDLERERGITIQMHPVTIYHQKGQERFELNLIDTPGHVDFNYEVSRSLAACEGAILLVDATQGVQAQTVANAFLAMEHDLTILPVLNKIDMAIARPDDVMAEMEQALGINPADVLRVSMPKPAMASMP